MTAVEIINFNKCLKRNPMSISQLLTPQQKTAVFADHEHAHSLAQAMPRLATEARRIAASAAAGLHGRKSAGQGNSFWQFREFGAGEAATRVDWRRSSRDHNLYVREREWEAAQTLWLWIDRSPSMAFISKLSQHSKLERAVVLGLALADMLVRGGERVGHFQLTSPQISRSIIERLGEALMLAEQSGNAPKLPLLAPIGGREEIIVISDFIADVSVLRTHIESLSARGGRGHLLLIRDPIEDIFSFTGETEFQDPHSGEKMRVGDAAGFGQAYRNRIAAHTTELTHITQKLGWNLTLHRTDKPATQPLYKLMMQLQGSV